MQQLRTFKYWNTVFTEPTSLYSGFSVFFLICVLFLAFFPISGFRYLSTEEILLKNKYCVADNRKLTLLEETLWLLQSKHEANVGELLAWKLRGSLCSVRLSRRRLNGERTLWQTGRSNRWSPWQPGERSGPRPQSAGSAGCCMSARPGCDPAPPSRPPR